MPCAPSPAPLHPRPFTPSPTSHTSGAAAPCPPQFVRCWATWALPERAQLIGRYIALGVEAPVWERLVQQVSTANRHTPRAMCWTALLRRGGTEWKRFRSGEEASTWGRPAGTARGTTDAASHRLPSQVPEIIPRGAPGWTKYG